MSNSLFIIQNPDNHEIIWRDDSESSFANWIMAEENNLMKMPQTAKLARYGGYGNSTFLGKDLEELREEFKQLINASTLQGEKEMLNEVLNAIKGFDSVKFAGD